MCRSFEVISGKKNKGDKGLLKGLTKMYRDAKYSVAIIPIPVELLEIDTRYQTEVRTDRSLMYLVNNWDENKLLPLYVEDMIVDNLGLEQAREVKENSTKLVMIKKRKNIA